MTGGKPEEFVVTAEHTRLEEAREQKALWKKWGPYLSERQWGTVREDCSDAGDAWDSIFCLNVCGFMACKSPICTQSKCG